MRKTPNFQENRGALEFFSANIDKTFPFSTKTWRIEHFASQNDKILGWQLSNCGFFDSSTHWELVLSQILTVLADLKLFEWRIISATKSCKMAEVHRTVGGNSKVYFKNTKFRHWKTRVLEVNFRIPANSLINSCHFIRLRLSLAENELLVWDPCGDILVPYLNHSREDAKSCIFVQNS